MEPPRSETAPVPRIRPLNQGGILTDRPFVLYWMTAFHRTRHNFALQRAVEQANHLGKPLLVLETLIVDYPWASDRIHRFFLEAMADNEKAFAGSKALYYPYVEKAKGERQGLLEALSAQAALVVTDDYPLFIPKKLGQAAAKGFDCRVEAVDSNGLLPLSLSEKDAPTAYVFRRFLQKTLPEQLFWVPAERSLKDLKKEAPKKLPRAWTKGWPQADLEELLKPKGLGPLPLDHSVPPVPGTPGGETAARKTLKAFLEKKLGHYAEERSEPSKDLGSGLAPYLHFGHLSVHEVVQAVFEKEDWNPGKLAPKGNGSKEGWWGLSPNAESFLDELVTWREVGYHFCHHRQDHDQYGSLPAWARATLEAHAKDPRDHTYTLGQFEKAQTHDLLWNAAQTQLLREGRIHNYLRMIWGKKILEWTPHPREALRIMIELNNKYALDGRDPNSYSGIFWCLGRFDRPWAPIRPVFGSVRYMSSANTAKKFNVKGYLAKYGPAQLTLDR